MDIQKRGRAGWRAARAVVVLVLWLVVGTPALESEDSIPSLRCGTRLVLIGELKIDVLAKCGPPLYEQTVGERIIRTSRGYDKKIVEEWIYNFGPTDFVHTLRFEGGRLVAIIRGERGYTLD